MKGKMTDHQDAATERPADAVNSSGSEGGELLDKLNDDELSVELKNYANRLSSEERIILQCWLEDRSPKNIAEALGVSEQRARYTIQKLMAKTQYFLRVYLEDKKKRISTVSSAHANAEILRRDSTSIAERKLEQMLLEAGLLSEVPPRITDFTQYQRRKPIKVKGEPVSETIIEERR